jgi:hypothetical protein
VHSDLAAPSPVGAEAAASGWSVFIVYVKSTSPAVERLQDRQDAVQIAVMQQSPDIFFGIDAMFGDGDTEELVFYGDYGVPALGCEFKRITGYHAICEPGGDVIQTDVQAPSTSQRHHTTPSPACGERWGWGQPRRQRCPVPRPLRRLSPTPRANSAQGRGPLHHHASRHQFESHPPGGVAGRKPI